MQTEFVQQLGVQVVFAQVAAFAQHACAAAHGAHMGASADGGGAAHDGLLVGVLEQAHFIEHGAQVFTALRAQRTKA